ncbi:MAG: NOL1/NOP2/fmu family ribosome biogenesis protein [Patescibacteria group bacterium]|jgi:NOL1/NOP2/fmu family ribosome biogenesis protein
MRIEPLTKAKKKKIIEPIEELGLTKIPELLLKSGKEKIRAFSGDLTKEEIYDIYHALPIEGIGLYIAKEIVSPRTGVREVRLSLDGAIHYKDQITHNIIVLTEEQEVEWFLGKNIELNEEQQKKYPYSNKFVVIKSADEKDIIGTGKIDSDILILHNYLAKERRRKQQLA